MWGKIYFGGTVPDSFTGVIAYDVAAESIVSAAGGYSYIHLQDPVAGNISLAVTSLGENIDGVEEHKVSISYSHTQSRVDLMEYTVGYQSAQSSVLYNNAVGFTGNIASGDFVVSRLFITYHLVKQWLDIRFSGLWHQRTNIF